MLGIIAFSQAYLRPSPILLGTGFSAVGSHYHPHTANMLTAYSFLVRGTRLLSEEATRLNLISIPLPDDGCSVILRTYHNFHCVVCNML